MKRGLLAIIWLAALVIDAIILPALHGGMVGGLGSVVTLIAIAVSFAAQRWVIGWGLVIAFVAEVVTGMYFGSLMGTWLVIVWLWHGMQHVISLKPAVEQNSWFEIVPVWLGAIVLFVAAQITQWIIVRLAYESSLSFVLTQHIISSPQIMIVAVLELLVLIAGLRLLYRRQPSFYG